MRIADITMEALLKKGGLANEQEIAALKKEAETSRRPLQELVIQEELIKEIDLTEAYGKYIDIPFVHIESTDIPSEVLYKIPERIARQYNAVLFQIDESGVHHLAMDDPDDVQAVSFIEKQLGSNLKIHIATRDNILACLENYTGDVNEKLNDVIDTQRENDADKAVYRKRNR